MITLILLTASYIKSYNHFFSGLSLMLFKIIKQRPVLNKGRMTLITAQTVYPGLIEVMNMDELNKP